MAARCQKNQSHDLFQVPTFHAPKLASSTFHERAPPSHPILLPPKHMPPFRYTVFSLPASLATEMEKGEHGCNNQSNLV
eukprot:05330_5